MLGSNCLCLGSGSGSSALVDSTLLHHQKDKDNTLLLDESTDLPVCNYDENPTPLYKAMEEHQWGAVARFLKTGVWPGSFFSDSLTPKEQCKTWVHRYDDEHHELRDSTTAANTGEFFKSMEERARLNTLRQNNKRVLRWKQLPLHAALIFMAPPAIVKKLIELFPYALRCPDDKGMLPLHLAFRQAVPDDILTIMLRMFANAMHVRDTKGRLPVECVRVDMITEAAAGTPALRGMIVQSIMQQSKEKFSHEQQTTVEKFQQDITSLQSKLEQLESHLERMGEREEQTRQELTTTLDQLSDLKKNHRKLQELQRYSLQKQTEQQQQHEFQQRVMEQLNNTSKANMATTRRRRTSAHYHNDDEDDEEEEEDSRDDYHHATRGSSRRRGRPQQQHQHQQHQMQMPPPSRTPSTPPSLPRQESRYSSEREEDHSMIMMPNMMVQRAPTQSSYYSHHATKQPPNNIGRTNSRRTSLDHFLDKYNDDDGDGDGGADVDEAYMTEENSYSPSSYYSDFTNRVLLPNQTGYTTAKSSVATNHATMVSNMKRDDTMTWMTKDSAYYNTMMMDNHNNNKKTPKSRNNSYHHHNHRSSPPPPPQPLHAHQSVLPHKPIKQVKNATKPERRPTPVVTTSATAAGRGGGRGGPQVPANKSVAKSVLQKQDSEELQRLAAAGACPSPQGGAQGYYMGPLSWDFSGFLKPLTNMN